MGLLPTNIRCDWPRCQNHITLDLAEHAPEDYGWECRLYSHGEAKLYVCSCHAKQSLRQLLVAWTKEASRSDSVAFGEEAKADA